MLQLALSRLVGLMRPHRAPKMYPTDLVLDSLRAKLVLESNHMNVLDIHLDERRNEISIKIEGREQNA